MYVVIIWGNIKHFIVFLPIVEIKMSKCQNVNPSSADTAHIAVAAHKAVAAAAEAEEDVPRVAAVANHGRSTPKTKDLTISKTYKI
jgi:hypothetical protein